MSHSTRAFRVLPLVLAAPALFTACAGGDATTGPTSGAATSAPPSSMAVSTPSASPATSQLSDAPETSTSPVPSTSPVTSTSPETSSSPVTTSSPAPSAGSASASSSGTAKASASAAAITLPDSFGTWVRVESSTEGRWSVAGYNQGSQILQLRAARTPNDPTTVLRSIVGTKGIIDSSGRCGQRGATSACVQTKAGVTYALVSRDMVTEELDGLFHEVFQAV